MRPPRSQRFSCRIKKIKASIAGIFSRKRGQTTSRGRTVPELRREAIQQRREGKRLPQPLRVSLTLAQLTSTQRPRLAVPPELRGPVDRKPLPPSPEHTLRRRPPFKRGCDGAYQCQGAPYEQLPPPAWEELYRNRPLPRPPTYQTPQRRQEGLPGLDSPFEYRQMPRNALEAGQPRSRVPRDSRLDEELPPPEHEASSPLFPAPLNVSRSASGRRVRPGSLTERMFEPADREPLNGNRRTHDAQKSVGRVGSATRARPVDVIYNPAGAMASESGHISFAPSESLVIEPGDPPEEVHPALREPTPSKSKRYPARRDQHASEDKPLPQTPPTTSNSKNSLRAIPRPSSEREPPAHRNATNRPTSLPSKHPEPGRASPDAPMQPPTVNAVATWLSENLSHVPYAITSLSALSMWGFPRYLPTHVSILCPEHCRNVVTGWAVATGVVLYPRQKGFGLQLRGEDGGRVRRVRVKFVPADVFSAFRTVGAARVLSLASLVDVLAGEFMDMAGENAGEKRVVLGGGITWAVDRMIETRAEVGEGEVRNVGNPLFLEPFACTFPGSREAFFTAGLVPAQGAGEQWSRGSAREGARAADGMRRAPSKRAPWAASPQRR